MLTRAVDRIKKWVVTRSRQRYWWTWPVPERKTLTFYSQTGLGFTKQSQNICFTIPIRFQIKCLCWQKSVCFPSLQTSTDESREGDWANGFGTVSLSRKQFKPTHLLQLGVVFPPVFPQQLLSKLRIKKEGGECYTLRVELCFSSRAEKYQTFFLLSSLAVRSSSFCCARWPSSVLLSGTSSLISASCRSCSSWSMALSRLLLCSKLAFFSSSWLLLW